MAAALPTLQPGLTDRGWPSWFVSLAEHPPSPVRRYTNVVLGDPRGLRQLGLFCEAGKSRPEVATTSNCSVVFEGFLYNAKELANELGVSERSPAPRR